MDAQPLTDRELAFVEEYIVDFDGPRAARRVGVAANKARSAATVWLERDDIRAAVTEAQQRKRARVLVDQDRVVMELARIATLDVRRFVKWGTYVNPQTQVEEPWVRFISSAELDADTASAIHSVERNWDGTIKAKFYDKLKALQLLGMHLGMFAKPGEDVVLNMPIKVIDYANAQPWPPAPRAANPVQLGSAATPSGAAGRVGSRDQAGDFIVAPKSRQGHNGA